MAQRLDLQALFLDILESENVYFQPPNNAQIKYPCIVYDRDLIVPDHADNKPYLLKKRYEVTVIDRDPDSEIPDKIAALPLCVHVRFFIADNLNHDVFRIFF